MEPPVERWIFGGELAAAKPSSFSAPPRIFNMIFDAFESDMRACLLEAYRRAKPAAGAAGDDDAGGMGEPTMSREESVTDNEWMSRVSAPRTPEGDAVWKKYRDLMGNHCTAITTGSAPVRPEVLRAVRECYQLRGRIRVFESCGTTESGGILVDDAPAHGVRVKLIPIPREDGDAASADP
jgi:long-subunit acyl-CoA synthetase (AMP-forming)